METSLENIKKAVTTILQAKEGVLFGYVFGSRATGNTKKGSDVDIGVYLDPVRQEQFFDIRLELIEKITRAVSMQADVVVLNTAAPFLKYVVLKEGRVVFARDEEARIDFELKAINEYFDYKHVLEQYHNRLQSSV